MSHHPYFDQTRLLVARMEGEDSPYIIGAYPMSTWDVIPEDDWSDWRQETAARFFGPDWTSYDYIEIVVTIPQDQLLAMFKAREVVPTKVERGDK